MRLHAPNKALLTLVIAALCPMLRAQAPAPPAAGPEAPIHTLRVFMDLIQVSVLVLDSELDRIKPIDPSKFLVSLDSGPAFRPRRVRQQGDDPISVAILLDAQGEPEVMPKVTAALATLAPGALHADDRITIYGLDCTLTRTLHDAAPDPQTLQIALDTSIAGWTERHKLKQPTPPCANRINLWDAMNSAVKELSTVPGRRILLVVSNGEDHGSVARSDEVRSLAQFFGVAVFGYSGPNNAAIANRIGTANPTNGRPVRGGIVQPSVMLDTKPAIGPFDSICQSSGGMLITVQNSSMPKQIVKFGSILRERYILEFTRPRNETPGQHSIAVTVDGHPTAFIRPAGVSILSPVGPSFADPNVIPRDTTNAPEFGKQKPKQP